jgi:hypothetical protein
MIIWVFTIYYCVIFIRFLMQTKEQYIKFDSVE